MVFLVRAPSTSGGAGFVCFVFFFSFFGGSRKQTGGQIRNSVLAAALVGRETHRGSAVRKSGSPHADCLAKY